MKRFISEYAKYKIKHYENNELMNVEIKTEKINQINKALNLVKKGFITIDEAIKVINNA